MSNAEKIERWIAEWETKRDAAREAGDYDAFAAAEREIANYRQMLAQFKCLQGSLKPKITDLHHV